MAKRLKVLVSAYACEAGKGSEPGVGWNWVNQIARFHDVSVITRENNRESIEKMKSELPTNVQYEYFDLPRWLRFWKKGNRGVHLYYYLWQIGAFFVAKRLHKEKKFDLVQHITFGVYWMPSFMPFLEIPFIYGPLGGAESTPPEFYKTFGLRGKFYEWLRNTVRWIAEKDPFVLFSIRKADVVLAKVNETNERLIILGAKKVEVYPESGISKDELEKINSFSVEKSKMFRLISIGRLLHWKGFHLGLMAFSRFQREFPSSEYYFIGDGPELKNLKAMTEQLEIADKVRFINKLTRDEVLQKLTTCDVLVHPSLHDSGGWVCLEAMASGKPVVCLDLGGPSMQVTDKTGFKVNAINPEQAVNDIANAMIKLAGDSDLSRDMGIAARERVEKYFDWDNKGEWVNKIYQESVA